MNQTLHLTHDDDNKLNATTQDCPENMPQGSLVTASTDLHEQNLIELCTKLSSQYYFSEYNVQKRKQAQLLAKSSSNEAQRSLQSSPCPSPTLRKRTVPGSAFSSPQSPSKPLSNLTLTSPTKLPIRRSVSAFADGVHVDENTAPQRRQAQRSRSPARSSSPSKDDTGDINMRSSSPVNSGRTSPSRAPPASPHAIFAQHKTRPITIAAQEALLDPVETPDLPGFPPMRRSASARPHASTPPLPKALDKETIAHSSYSTPPSPQLAAIRNTPVPEHLIRTSHSHPLNVSPMIPPQYLDQVSAAVYALVSPQPIPAQTPWILYQSPVTRLSSEQLFAPVCGTHQASKELGNLLLSSCPGKKVRLTGPILENARSAIRRDLRVDLERMVSKDCDTRAIICCLDDQELALLGVEWQDYSTIAADMGIDLVRLPIAEGHAPDSILEMDELLSYIIRRYTLHGENVLVHCRGGVGRAGLFAVSWALKMGMFGNLDGYNQEEIVSQCISWIRRRRSTKAIETPLQVFFLHSYIGFLTHEAVEIPVKQLGI